MLKNIKLFSTDSDRTTYESSASYETPYVSKVAADNSVHYNKLIRIINFTVAELFFGKPTRNTTYQAEEGMTWEEWVESDYNTNYYNIETVNDKVYYLENNGEHVSDTLGTVVYCISFNNTLISPEDTIVENRLYTTTYDGANPE